jgi:hypothetical protein
VSMRRRLETLEGRTKARRREPDAESREKVREWMRDSLERFAAWRRAGSPDDEEGRQMRKLVEAVRRRSAQMRGEGRT